MEELPDPHLIEGEQDPAEQAAREAFTRQLLTTMDFIQEQHQPEFTALAVSREMEIVRVLADELMGFYQAKHDRKSRKDILLPIINNLTQANKFSENTVKLITAELGVFDKDL